LATLIIQEFALPVNNIVLSVKGINQVNVIPAWIITLFTKITVFQNALRILILTRILMNAKNVI
jgi:hypothetical protein